MRVALLLICLALPAAASGVRAQSPAALEEAARLSAEVVKLYAAGKYDEALPLAVRALELREKELGRDDKLVAGALLNLAAVERSLDKPEEAKAHYRRADEVFDAAEGKRGPLQGGVINGKAVSKPQPAYPQEAKLARAQGTITVQTLIGETGTVLSACAFGEGHPSLKAASEFASYRARFTPTLVNGKPVKVRGVITYRFVLR